MSAALQIVIVGVEDYEAVYVDGVFARAESSDALERWLLDHGGPLAIASVTRRCEERRQEWVECNGWPRELSEFDGVAR